MRLSKPLLATALLLGACLGAGALAGAVPVRTLPTLASCVKSVRTEVLVRGELTIATNNPAIPPWFVNNQPSNGKGYEAAVAYDVAAALGFKHAAVTWYPEPYELSETSGPKKFDFDINEITYDPKLTTDVSFSSSYFNVNQAIVAMSSDRITTRHTPSELRSYLYGVPTGSPGLSFIKTKIRPTRAPRVYKSLALAISALEAHKIDAIVIDTPTAQYLATQQLKGAVVVGQFHTTGQYYALVLQRSNPLVACVDTALHVLASNGSLARASKAYLGIYNKIGFLRP